MKSYCFFQFGLLELEYENETVHGLRTIPKEQMQGYEAEKEEKSAFTNLVFGEIEQYLRGERKKFSFSYELSGTAFQKNVYRELAKIPYGETRSYKQIAEAIGSPRAYRAVGLANNRNPLQIIIPCHRILGSDGKLVGYAGGMDMKKYLLALEK